MRSPNGSGAKWNESRDGRILHALGRAVLLTVSQVQLVGRFGSREAAARRMRKLTKMGYVRVFRSRDKTLAHRYGLTELGRGRVEEAYPDLPAARLHVASGIKRRDINHVAKLADVRIAVGIACDGRRDLALADYLGEADLRGFARRGDSAFLPDAFLVLEAASVSRQLGVWVEVDRGTTPARRFAERKLLVLGQHIAAGASAFGLASWVVLVLPGTERRGDAVSSRLGGLHAPGPGAIWWASLPDFLSDPLGGELQSADHPDIVVTLAELLFQQRVPPAATTAAPHFRAASEG